MPRHRVSPLVVTFIFKRLPLLPVAWPLPLVGALLALAGCAGYHARPLTPAAVEAALATPDFAAVRLAAGSLRHPLLAPVMLDPREGFTPDELAVVAVVVSPQLRALRDQRGVVQAQVVQAGLLPNPQLNYSLDHPTGNADPTLVTGSALGLSAELTALLGRRDRVAGARATAGALDLDIAWQEWQVAQDVRLRAYRVLSLGQRLPLARALEADLAENTAALRTALGHHLATAAEITDATLAWRQAQTARVTLEQTQAEDEAALRLALHLPPDAPLPLKAAVEPPAPPGPDATPAAWLEGLETRRLDLVALRLGYESQEAGVRAAVKAQFPKISLGLTQASDTSNVRTRGVGLTIDLPLFDRNQAGIASAEATRAQLFDDYVARVAEARSEVTQLLARRVQVRARRDAGAVALPDLERFAAGAERALANHVIDAATARAARSAWVEQRSEQLRLQQDLFELNVALEIAAGRPSLGHPATVSLP